MGGINTYAYVGSNPLNWIDPTGKFFFVPLLGPSVATAIADLVTIGALGQAASNVLNDIYKAEQGDNETSSPDDLTNSIGKISDKTGLSPKEVRDRIHKAKRNLPKSTTKRNPDCKVDLNAGEIYPEIPEGGVGDSFDE